MWPMGLLFPFCLIKITQILFITFTLVLLQQKLKHDLLKIPLRKTSSTIFINLGTSNFLTKDNTKLLSLSNVKHV